MTMITLKALIYSNNDRDWGWWWCCVASLGGSFPQKLTQVNRNRYI